MSNISRGNFQVVQNMNLPWSLFSAVFASGHVGMRKPDLCFFEHVIDETGCRPNQVVMVDDQAENICAARSFGIHGLVVDKNSVGIICQTLQNLFQGPLARAEVYIKANAGNHRSVVEGQDITLKDNFAQLFIWGITGDANLVDLKWPSTAQVNGHGKNTKLSTQANVNSGLWNYFCEDPIFTTKEFPADADTTSMAYLSLPESYLLKITDVNLVLDKNGIKPKSGWNYAEFCDDRPRTTPEVCVNMLRVFYRFGRGNDPRIKTKDWAVQCLKNQACLYGNRVYTTPETFLYFTAQLYMECGADGLKDRPNIIREALLERINVLTHPVSLALRVLACQVIGLPPVVYRQDLKLLLSLQKDGGFPAGHFCCMGRTGVRIGNRGLMTALVIKILRHEEQNPWTSSARPKL